MGFDSKSFLKAKFQARTTPVAVPDLGAFFGEGEKPEWIVRGLTGKELGRANETAAKNDTISAIVSGLGSVIPSEIEGTLKELFSKDTPQDVAKRIELLQMGSVDPVCSLDLALRLCKNFPAEFYMITNKIIELTGKGSQAAKKKD
ncbi:MAG: hypothetical protein M0P69_03745 [Bacteroidales bacterium]|jgi:hypothetical protein|nr:hypothetical protein [Bacteroidales bacterium]